MREILFRGKREDDGLWLFGDLRQWSGKKKGIYDNACCKTFRVDPETVGQFIGLTDTNGVKIFEGDIVEITREDEPFKVEWREDSARFILSASTFCCDFDNYWGYETEVIGNIHDNPELLEEVTT